MSTAARKKAEVYKHVLRPLLFRMDAERAHNLAIRAAEVAGRSNIVRGWAQRTTLVDDLRLKARFGELEFANPLGLAAGFDKNGRAISYMGSIGFGHVEIGSISAHSSIGNPKPRLFRIPDDQAIVVAYGVPNDGAPAVAQRLKGNSPSVPLGINLVKTNDPTRPAVEPDVYEDFADSFRVLQSHASYIALNLSCPNSLEDRDFFDDLPRIGTLLDTLKREDPEVPVVLKLKPVSDRAVLREIVSIADDFPFVAGFAINLPAGRRSELTLSTPQSVLNTMPGAIGGPPVREVVDSILAQLRSIIGQDSRYGLIAAGGVSTAAEAYRKIRLGASLVQMYTGLVYHGPGVVKDILTGLSQLLEDDGQTCVSAQGLDAE